MAKTIGEKIADYHRDLDAGKYNTHAGAITFDKPNGWSGHQVTATVLLDEYEEGVKCRECSFPIGDAISARIFHEGSTDFASTHVRCIPWSSLPGRPDTRNATPSQAIGSPTKGQRAKLATAIVAGQVPMTLHADTETMYPGSVVTFADGKQGTGEITFADHLAKLRERKVKQSASLAQQRSLIDTWSTALEAGAILPVKA